MRTETETISSLRSSKNQPRVCFPALALCLVATLGGQLAAQTWQSAGPAPRYRHSAVLDASGKAMVVFGGSFTNPNVGTFFNANDVWRLNGNLTWTELSPTGTPPVGRSDHSAVYDAVNNRMIIFGGADPHGAALELLTIRVPTA